MVGQAYSNCIDVITDINIMHIITYSSITKTPLTHVMVSPIATCTGDAFLSTHWWRYRTYTSELALCSGVFLAVVVVDVYVCGGGGCSYGVVVYSW